MIQYTWEIHARTNHFDVLVLIYIYIAYIIPISLKFKIREICIPKR